MPPKVIALLPFQERIDDRTIPDTLIVWRTLDPSEAPIDPATGQPDIMSSVFRSEEISVYLSDHITLTNVVDAEPGSLSRSVHCRRCPAGGLPGSA